jgi:predicted nucleic acid-binding protein
MWLVDSIKYIDWIRQGKNPTRILRPYVLAGQIATCGVVRVEVIRGTVKPSVQNELSELFDAMIEVALSTAVWKRVAAMAWTLDRQGVVLPTTDLTIAGCARHVGAAVITRDPHFSRIPGLSVQSDLPEPPPDLTRSAFPFLPA